MLVNGVSDHVHLLFVQPAALSLADLMAKVKANSSGWVKRRWAGRREFGWQTGYAAFSVSKSQADRVKHYIAKQAEHHKRVSFQEEVLSFLKRQESLTTRNMCLTERWMSPRWGFRLMVSELLVPTAQKQSP
jgi:putative transposase